MSGSYRPEFFERLALLEERSFWFRARNRLILWALRRYQPHLQAYLELGCGTGYVLSSVARAFPQAQLTGSELHSEGLAIAKDRLPQARLVQMDACQIPYADEFDAIGAFDMLEHIPDDATALAQARAALRPGGVLLVTVPQHAWLWSALDDSAGHQRRYAAAELHAKARQAGLELLWSGSFVSLLLPVLVLARWRRRSAPSADGLPELSLPRALNALLAAFMGLEYALIRLGCRFPWGGSRLMVARKPAEVPGA